MVFDCIFQANSESSLSYMDKFLRMDMLALLQGLLIDANTPAAIEWLLFVANVGNLIDRIDASLSCLWLFQRLSG